MEAPMNNVQVLEMSLSLLIQKILQAADVREFQLQLQLQTELHAELVKPEQHLP